MGNKATKPPPSESLAEVNRKIDHLNELLHAEVSAKNERIMLLCSLSEEVMMWKRRLEVTAVLDDGERASRVQLDFEGFEEVYHLVSSFMEAEQAMFDKLSRLSDGVKRSDEGFEDAECCVCMERNSNIVLKCLHGFCEQCLRSWNKRAGGDEAGCPLCRAPITAALKDDDVWTVVEETPTIEFLWAEIKRRGKK